MERLETALDLVVAALLVAFAWRTLTAPRLYQAAIFFIGFGLGMALAWSRMAAPDVALAEAAIGAGLLGVLLIDSLKVFTREARGRNEGLRQERAALRPTRSHRFVALLAALGGLAFMIVWTLAILEMPTRGGLSSATAEALPESGVEHPVTAVLLNFRGYDTWLEIGVLLLAMLGIFCAVGKTGFDREDRPQRVDLLINWLVRALVPLMILVSGYVLWLGTTAPGGAFQSGVILGAAGILLRIGGFRVFGRMPVWAWKAALVFGFGLFLAFGILSLFSGRFFLQYPAPGAGSWILIVETACALSIGFTLLAFYVCLNASGTRLSSPPRKTVNQEP